MNSKNENTQYIPCMLDLTKHQENLIIGHKLQIYHRVEGKLDNVITKSSSYQWLGP